VLAPAAADNQYFHSRYNNINARDI
jgi:hypothetical protein